MENTTAQFSSSIEQFWYKVVDYLPRLLAAAIVLLIGLILAVSLGKLVKKLVSYTKIDELIDRTNINKYLADSGIKFSFAGVAGWLVKWFLIFATFIIAADILNWQQIDVFLNEVLLYLPNILIAVFILAIGFLAGQFIYEVVIRSMKASKVLSGEAGILADVAKWSIIIFAVMASLAQLKIGGRLVEILFAGIIFAASLGFALAFGLGGRDKASEWLDRWKK